MKKGIFIVIVLIIVGWVAFKYIYKSHRDIETEKPSYTLKSLEIIDEFTVNIESATEKYLNKTIVITGNVTETDIGMILLDDKIVCYMSDSINNSSLLNTMRAIKGRFIGYDELLEELKIDQSTIISTN